MKYNKTSFKNVRSTYKAVEEQLKRDIAKNVSVMDSWSWTLSNDLPYSKWQEIGFTTRSGRRIAGVKMLDQIENRITQGAFPPDALGDNASLATIKASLDKQFKDLLDVLRAPTKEITPIRSGLMARGADEVIWYMRADKRYRDGDYGGWTLSD